MRTKSKEGQGKPSLEMQRLTQKVNNLMSESQSVPTARAAKFDPPPVSVGKTLWITRKVRVSKKLDLTAFGAGAAITVDDVKAQSSSAPFKVAKVSAWLPGRLAAEFALGDGTWINDTTSRITYTDIAPPSRAPGVVFNIPDQLAEIMNTGTTQVVTVKPFQDEAGAAGNILFADVTIRYQI